MIYLIDIHFYLKLNTFITVWMGFMRYELAFPVAPIPSYFHRIAGLVAGSPWDLSKKMERILSSEQISIKLGTSVVETLYFFMICMPQRDQVEQKEI